MNGAEGLSDDVKTFIVQQLACFDTPSVVAEAVKTEFEITVSRQAVHAYDPTKKAGVGLSDKWRTLFGETREKFLAEAALIGIANKNVRLRMLDRMARSAETRGNIAMAAAMCEQAAKEMGGAYTNQRKLEHTGKDGERLAPTIIMSGCPEAPPSS